MTEAAQTVQAMFIATVRALQVQTQPVIQQQPYSLSHVANQCCVLAIVIMVGCAILAALFYVVNEPPPPRLPEQEAPEMSEIYEQLEGRESSEKEQQHNFHSTETEGE